MYKIFFILFLLPLTAQAESHFELFGDKIYKDPIAGVRSTEIGISLKNSSFLGARVYYLEAEIGRSVPILSLHHDKDLSLQIGIDAGTWVVLAYKDGAFPLVMNDFYFGFPLAFRYKKFSGAVKFNHISSHMGDGMHDILYDSLSKKEKRDFDFKQKIAEENGVDLTLADPLTYSRDFLSFHFAYDYDKVIRSYVHAGYVHKRVPRGLKRWFVGNGLEFKFPINNRVSLYYAQDLTYNQDVDSLDYSGETGIILIRKSTEARIALTSYIGSDRRGQLYKRRLKQFGIGIFIR